MLLKSVLHVLFNLPCTESACLQLFLKQMLGTWYGPAENRFSLILGTRWWFSLFLGTRYLILGTRIGSLKHLKKTLVFAIWTSCLRIKYIIVIIINYQPTFWETHSDDVYFIFFVYCTCSDVSESFLSSQNHLQFFSRQSAVTRIVESLRVIGLQAQVNVESHEISRFFNDIFF